MKRRPDDRSASLPRRESSRRAFRDKRGCSLACVPAAARTVAHRNRRACALTAPRGPRLASAAAGVELHAEDGDIACKRSSPVSTRAGNVDRMPGTRTTAAQRPASARPTSPEPGFHQSKYRASVWRAGRFFHPTGAASLHFLPARRIAEASRHRGAGWLRRSSRGARGCGDGRRTDRNSQP